MKVLIIGAGPAGYTASIYAARANLNPTQLLGSLPGGQLMITTDVENYPGFASVVQGPWLMEQMKLQAEHVGVSMLPESATSIEVKKGEFLCHTDQGNAYLAKAIIIATGAKAKWLGLPSEKEFLGRGVSACATCDGFFFKNKRVAIVGGGNTAVQEAIFLTNFASHVTLIHRRDQLRAEKTIQDRFFKNPKVTFFKNSQVEEILGNNGVTGVRLSSGEILNVDGVFIAIGHKPESEFVKDLLELDHEGYIKTHNTKTSIPGIFAAGDVQDKIYRQAVTAAGQGCMAALEAERYIEGV